MRRKSKVRQILLLYEKKYQYISTNFKLHTVSAYKIEEKEAKKHTSNLTSSITPQFKRQKPMNNRKKRVETIIVAAKSGKIHENYVKLIMKKNKKINKRKQTQNSKREHESGVL